MRRLKKVFKVVAVLGLVLALLAGAFFVHVWYFKPYDVNLFFGRVALQFALESPELLSTLRIFEPLGLDWYNDDLDDESLEAGDRMFARIRDARDVLRSYEDADLSPADLRSKQIMLSLLDTVVEGERFRYHVFPVNQMFGIQNGFPTFMEEIHQVNDVGDAEDYVARLSRVGIQFDQVLEGLRRRESLGIQPPQFVIDKVIGQMLEFTGTPVEQASLYTSFVEKLEKAGIADPERGRLQAEARDAIDHVVYPAYGRLIAYFRELDEKVEGNRGAWSLPDGDAYYRLALRLFTTTDASPAEIHQTGLAEVERLQAQILAILEAEGRDTSGGFSAAMRALEADDRFYYPDTDAGREAILAEYAAIIREIEGGLDPAFDIRPRASIEVRREAAFKEASTAAHYEPPAMDGSRPGAFVAPLADIRAVPRYSMRTLAYHEGVPGHHFQIAIQFELEDLPFFRRLIPFSAFSEGWGLYAEQLAWELGFQQDPYDNVGRLQGELFRAVRLVVDTGIHDARWSREQAIEYMLANAGMAESQVVSEIERYFVMPGQACSYKVGMMKILELRERARAQLGPAFDLRDFHRVVLTNGSMPLTLLEKVVDEYIESARAGAAGAAS